MVAGHRGLARPVRWCHVAEVPDIARLLVGGELLLTTGLALDPSPEQQERYLQELHRAGVAGVMLELGRRFQTAPASLVKAADATATPLITLPYDTPFVRVTEAVHTLVISRRQAAGSSAAASARAGPQARQLVADLAEGRVTDRSELKERLDRLGVTAPDEPWLAFLVADAAQGGAHAQTLFQTFHCPSLFHRTDRCLQLVAFGPDPARLTQALGNLARLLGRVPAGVGRPCASPKEAPRSLAEAALTMRLRRRRPEVAPFFSATGVCQLALADLEGVRQFVAAALGPLIEYDRIHRADFCRTLRVLLDDGLTVAAAARRLHLTRQALYYRRRRIAEILNQDLEDVEVRLTLAVALRLREALEEDPDQG